MSYRLSRFVLGHRLMILFFIPNLIVPGCRHKRTLSRGETAVVVMAPKRDAAGPPKLIEQEPNDKAEQAQILPISENGSAVSVKGSLEAIGKGTDVDFFKIVVPEGQPTKPSHSIDSGWEEPQALQALPRRLALDVTSQGCGVAVQVLDEDLKVIESITTEAGETAGIPNLAVVPGHSYFFRVKNASKAAKSAKSKSTTPSDVGLIGPPILPQYELGAILGDFEAADEKEPNDLPESAETLVMHGSTELAGYLGWKNDQDYFRIQSPETPSVLDLELDGVEGVAAGLQVVSTQGTQLAIAHGRKGERVDLRNVAVPVKSDEKDSSFYVVVRGENGHNRTRRYVLRLTLGAPKLNFETEPNDDAGNANLVHEGVFSGYLPLGDVDYFRYVQEGRNELTIEVAFPVRIRGKVEVIRQEDGFPLNKSEAKKAHQTVVMHKIPSSGSPLLIRLSSAKGDGNTSDPYSLRISSVPIQPE
jgi:hypothetical protein